MDEKRDQLQNEFESLEEFLAKPDAYTDPDFADKSKRHSELESLLNLFEEKSQLEQQIAQAKELSEGDGELAEMAAEEATELESKLESTTGQIEDALTPKDPNDSKNVIVEIRAGAGGDEASLFSGDLFRMYTRYCERTGFKTELVSQSDSEVGGFKEIIFNVTGDSPYATFKFESGVHRVQRIPSTESQGRIHTSTSTVAVIPEAEEKDVEIKNEDLKIDTYRASGHGGQSVNTTDSAVRITHLPTGIVVSMQDEKSQIKNRQKALKILRSRILQQQIEEQQQEASDRRRALIGTGDRSEKIRTYNFPQDRITDHRINYSRSNIVGAMDGDIQDLIDELQKQEKEIIRNDN